jgi:hypothetical protein
VWAQLPTIVTPASGATGVAISGITITFNSASTGNSVGSPETFNIELSNAADFYSGSGYWQSADILRTDDVPTNYNYGYDGATLSPGTLYYIRVLSDVNGEGTTSTFTTVTLTVPTNITCQLAVVAAPGVGFGSAPNTAAASLSVFPNARSLRFTLNRTITNATQYVIQFDTTSSNFNNPVDSIIVDDTVSASVANYRVDIGWLTGAKLSGSTVFVRARGINSTSRGAWGAVRKYGAPLQPCRLVSPTASPAITRTAFKLWTTSVKRGTRYYFQVSTNNFATYYSMTGTLAAKNETASGITGNVFRNNYSVGGSDVAFDYLGQLANNTAYSIRVRAWNNQQVGYWADTIVITPSPTLTASIKTPVNAATNQATGLQFSFNDDPNFVETSYDFQISTNNTFTGTLVDVAGIGTRSYYTTALNYNTTYYARVRSNVGTSFTSAWSSTVTFTTKSQPTLSITYPTPSQVWSSRGVFAYSTWENGVTSYQWEIQKTNLPSAANFTGTSTFYGRNFLSYLVAGGTYQIRVRGVVGSQSITGPYSAWVSFSVSASAPMPPPAIEAQTNNNIARVGDNKLEPVAYPNPFSNELMLALPEDAVGYTVSNLSGQTIETNNTPQPTQQLGITWPQGIYHVQVLRSAGQVSHLKVVKQ